MKALAAIISCSWFVVASSPILLLMGEGAQNGGRVENYTARFQPAGSMGRDDPTITLKLLDEQEYVYVARDPTQHQTLNQTKAAAKLYGMMDKQFDTDAEREALVQRWQNERTIIGKASRAFGETVISFWEQAGSELKTSEEFLNQSLNILQIGQVSRCTSDKPVGFQSEPMFLMDSLENVNHQVSWLMIIPSHDSEYVVFHQDYSKVQEPAKVAVALLRACVMESSLCDDQVEAQLKRAFQWGSTTVYSGHESCVYDVYPFWQARRVAFDEGNASNKTLLQTVTQFAQKASSLLVQPNIPPRDSNVADAGEEHADNTTNGSEAEDAVESVSGDDVIQSLHQDPKRYGKAYLSLNRNDDSSDEEPIDNSDEVMEEAKISDSDLVFADEFEGPKSALSPPDGSFPLPDWDQMMADWRAAHNASSDWDFPDDDQGFSDNFRERANAWSRRGNRPMRGDADIEAGFEYDGELGRPAKVAAKSLAPENNGNILDPLPLDSRDGIPQKPDWIHDWEPSTDEMGNSLLYDPLTSDDEYSSLSSDDEAIDNEMPVRDFLGEDMNRYLDVTPDNEHYIRMVGEFERDLRNGISPTDALQNLSHILQLSADQELQRIGQEIGERIPNLQQLMEQDAGGQGNPEFDPTADDGIDLEFRTRRPAGAAEEFVESPRDLRLQPLNSDSSSEEEGYSSANEFQLESADMGGKVWDINSDFTGSSSSANDTSSVFSDGKLAGVMQKEEDIFVSRLSSDRNELSPYESASDLDSTFFDESKQEIHGAYDADTEDEGEADDYNLDDTFSNDKDLNADDDGYLADDETEHERANGISSSEDKVTEEETIEGVIVGPADVPVDAAPPPVTEMTGEASAAGALGSTGSVAGAAGLAGSAGGSLQVIGGAAAGTAGGVMGTAVVGGGTVLTGLMGVTGATLSGAGAVVTGIGPAINSRDDNKEKGHSTQTHPLRNDSFIPQKPSENSVQSRDEKKVSYGVVLPPLPPLSSDNQKEVSYGVVLPPLPPMRKDQRPRSTLSNVVRQELPLNAANQGAEADVSENVGYDLGESYIIKSPPGDWYDLLNSKLLKSLPTVQNELKRAIDRIPEDARQMKLVVQLDPNAKAHRRIVLEGERIQGGASRSNTTETRRDRTRLRHGLRRRNHRQRGSDPDEAVLSNKT